MVRIDMAGYTTNVAVNDVYSQYESKLANACKNKNWYRLCLDNPDPDFEKILDSLKADPNDKHAFGLFLIFTYQELYTLYKINLNDNVYMLHLENLSQYLAEYKHFIKKNKLTILYNKNITNLINIINSIFVKCYFYIDHTPNNRILTKMLNEINDVISCYLSPQNIVSNDTPEEISDVLEQTFKRFRKQ